MLLYSLTDNLIPFLVHICMADICDCGAIKDFKNKEETNISKLVEQTLCQADEPVKPEEEKDTEASDSDEK